MLNIELYIIDIMPKPHKTNDDLKIQGRLELKDKKALNAARSTATKRMCV